MSARGEMSPRRRSRSRSRRRRNAPPPVSLPDNEDMLREILLRLPPRPSSLPRASLVCKHWRSLVTDPQFQRRFRDHHGKPPLLGFFLHAHPSFSFIPMLDRPDRIPAARFSVSLEDGYITDCRHGLVLFLGQRRLLVWDPVAGEQRRLIPPPELDSDPMSIFHGGVLRPAGRQGCRSSHFQVALIANDRERPGVSACLYSSETGIWGNISSLQLQSQTGIRIGTSTLTGNSLCWLIDRNHQCVILEFDLDRQTLALRELPLHIDAGYHNLRIMPAEDGGLGFIYLSQFHAQLWKRMPDSDGLAVWVLYRAIDFEKVGSTCKRDYLILQGFAEENNAVLVRRPSGVFLVYLQSMEFKELSHTMHCYPHYPFACCYAAGTGILDGHDGDEVLNNM